MDSDEIGGPAPVWLLDVDGVLNATRPGWGGPPRQGSARHGHDVFRMRWAPKLMVELARLHHARAVEVRWATTWVDHIDNVEALFNLPAFPVAFSGLPGAPQITTPGLKIQAALHVVETERRPLIWTDDDAIEANSAHLPRLRAGGQPVLLISPDPRRGLQPDHLQAIADFIGEQAPSPTPS
jgi:hypothetical protein